MDVPLIYISHFTFHRLRSKEAVSGPHCASSHRRVAMPRAALPRKAAWSVVAAISARALRSFAFFSSDMADAAHRPFCIVCSPTGWRGRRRAGCAVGGTAATGGCSPLADRPHDAAAAPLQLPRPMPPRPAPRPRATTASTGATGLRSRVEADPSPAPLRKEGTGAAAFALTDDEFGVAAVEMDGAKAALGVASLLALTGAPVLSKRRRRGIRAECLTAPPSGPALSSSVMLFESFRDEEIGSDAEISLPGSGSHSSSGRAELAEVSPLPGGCDASIAIADGHAAMEETWGGRCCSCCSTCGCRSNCDCCCFSS